MRSIKELLKVMLDNQRYFYHGLCRWAGELEYAKLLSNKERQLLQEYIHKNRPFMLSSMDAFKHRHSDLYWSRGEISHRIKWIKKHIKKLE